MKTPRNISVVIGIVVLSSCSSVGPNYETPTAPMPEGTSFKEMGSWSMARPGDSLPHSNYWEIFGDPELNELEKQVDVSNQNIAAAFARLQQARALINEARAQYAPTVSVSPNVTTQHGAITDSNSQTVVTGNYTQFSVPVDATWVPDLWGRIANTVKQNTAAAQMSAADLENERLIEHADLAVAYYQLRAQDSLQQLYALAVSDYQKALSLTQTLHDTGIDSDEAVAQAETQLEQAQAQSTQIGIARAQYEHAIALLIGKPATSFSLPVESLKINPPAVPLGVPSQILQRRPDIASAERSMAAANAQIGITMAAYYPNLTLSGSAGIVSGSLNGLFNAPALIWSVGASLAQTIFDGGLRSAAVEQSKAAYQETVAVYRQTVLTAFQQVEDNLASLKLLEIEVKQQDAAVNSSKRYLKIATDRYKLGLDPYLNIISAQTSVLTSEQTEINLKMQQLTTTMQLIEALGGGWDSSELQKKERF